MKIRGAGAQWPDESLENGGERLYHFVQGYLNRGKKTAPWR